MKPTSEEIEAAIETLKKCGEQEVWFLTHELRSIGDVIEALESVLRYPLK